MQLKIKTLITYLNTGKSLDISYFYHSHHRDKTQTLIFLSGKLSNFVIINVFDIILMLFFSSHSSWSRHEIIFQISLFFCVIKLLSSFSIFHFNSVLLLWWWVGINQHAIQTWQTLQLHQSFASQCTWSLNDGLISCTDSSNLLHYTWGVRKHYPTPLLQV